jgi:hypothetical protein
MNQTIQSIQDEFESVIQETELRKVFPALEEQMSKLAPELQVQLHTMEEEYDKKLSTARIIRKEILDTTQDLIEANLICGDMIQLAVNVRKDKIKELRNAWGQFFYDNPK